MSNLKTLVNQLESYIANYEKVNLAVSQSSIGWHIDHSLMVINGIIDQLKKSNPEQYKWQFNWIRIFIQIINKIPRGKAKAPKVVQPLEPATAALLISKLEIAGDADRIREWIGEDFTSAFDGIEIDWINPSESNDETGLVAVHFSTPNGTFRLD